MAASTASYLGCVGASTLCVAQPLNLNSRVQCDNKLGFARIPTLVVKAANSAAEPATIEVKSPAKEAVGPKRESTGPGMRYSVVVKFGKANYVGVSTNNLGLCEVCVA